MTFFASQKILFRHKAFAEVKLVHGHTAYAHQVFLLADLKSGRALLDQQRRDAAPASIWIRRAEDGIERRRIAVRVPLLIAVQNIEVVTLFSTRFQTSRVRPGSLLRETESHQGLPLRDIRQILLFLLLRPA